MFSQCFDLSIKKSLLKTLRTSMGSTTPVPANCSMTRFRVFGLPVVLSCSLTKIRGLTNSPNKLLHNLRSSLPAVFWIKLEKTKSEPRKSRKTAKTNRTSLFENPQNQLVTIWSKNSHILLSKRFCFPSVVINVKNSSELSKNEATSVLEDMDQEMITKLWNT